MAKEIERKFLVKNTSYRELSSKSISITQAYLSRDPRATVRVRIIGPEARITVKGITEGAVRDEWEYAIPVEDAREMIASCASGRVIRKTRFIVPFDGMIWEVDEFEDTLAGLVVAEVELPAADVAITLPPFVGEEVTGDARYYNSSL